MTVNTLESSQVANKGRMIEIIEAAFANGVSEEMLDVTNRALAELFAADAMLQKYKGRKICLTQGSARTKPDDPEWKQYSRFGEIMSEVYNWIMKTGGGPGSMEAFLESADPKNSLGLGIKLPFETGFNPYLVEGKTAIEFKHFFSRKVTMMMNADAVVVGNPGWGTDDEAYETLALIQTGKSPIIPVVYLDTPDGKKIDGKTLIRRKHELNQMMVEYGTISEADLALYHFTDDAKEAADHIAHFYSTFNSIQRRGLEVSIRLNSILSEQCLGAIRVDFAKLIDGDIQYVPVSDGEGSISLEFKMRSYDYGRLRQLIDAINNG